MKKMNRFFGWLVALTVIAGTCYYAQASGWGGTYMNTSGDEDCLGSLFICATVED